MSDYIPAGIVVFYIALLYAISWWTRRLSAKGGLTGYFLAGRGLPMGVTAVMLTGLAVGGASTVGVAQRAYTRGLSAGWYGAAWAAGAVVMGLFAAGRYRKMEVSTVPELFERYYGTAGRVLGVLGQLVVQLVITSLQYGAGGAILSMLLPGLSFELGMLITAVVFIGITLIGGLWAAGLTNIINVTLIYVGVILGAALSFGDALSQTGGMEGLSNRLQELAQPGSDFGLWAMGPLIIGAWFLIMIPTVLGTQAVVQVSFASKTPSAAGRGFLLGGLLILPGGFISALIGISAAVVHPGLEGPDTAMALPKMVLDLNPFLAGLILAGLWAADVSTACGLLLGSSTLVVGDIVKRFFRFSIEGRREWWVARGTVLFISMGTFVMAITMSKDILKSLLAGLTLNAAFALILVATLFFPGICRRGSAAWTLAAAMVSLGAWFVLPESWRLSVADQPIYLVLPVTLLAFLLVSIFDSRRIEKPES